jgi:hypothetical protein
VPRLLIAALAASAGFLAPSLALAQNPGERVNQLIIYGDDPCPQGAGDEITVCARKDERERYRIPEPLRGSPSVQSDAWNNRVLAYETIGRQGTLSCSPVGPGGSTGCLTQLINKASAEKGADASVRFGDLIAAEREKRLSTIDAEAADTQKRVEQAERDYEARQKAQEAAAATPAPGQ